MEWFWQNQERQSRFWRHLSNAPAIQRHLPSNHSMTKILLVLVAFIGLTFITSPAAEAGASVSGPADHVRGKITAIAGAKHEFVVTHHNGSKHVVRVTKKTKIRVDGKPAKFGDLAVGQKVRAAGKLGPHGHVLTAGRVGAKN